MKIKVLKSQPFFFFGNGCWCFMLKQQMIAVRAGGSEGNHVSGVRFEPVTPVLHFCVVEGFITRLPSFFFLIGKPNVLYFPSPLTHSFTHTPLLLSFHVCACAHKWYFYSNRMHEHNLLSKAACERAGHIWTVGFADNSVIWYSHLS